MKKSILISLLLTLLLAGCSIKYSLNGASIDYTKIKTVSIADFQNLAPTVYPPLAQRFTEDLKDRFQRQTRLHDIPTNGDLSIEGEIVGYDLSAEAVQENAFAAKTRLTLRINVRFTNKVNEEESFEREFTSFGTFDSSQMFVDVQDQLCQELTKDIINQIFNATVENW
ncbi:MAG: LptE family protein [Porphyromonas sp.]|uniref:LptE family protein n=1 Tax=Porphyromonas sp. TaxID=1924944 RepID=UPI002A915B98|nr:LptE family protein [Porphyromonas sp.]MDD7468604.1 LptE family protein [Bacteroidales bacterium]MDY6101978.1 LptE family protein [Porphyromonas sp.]